jgi:hypothetical protein
MGATFGAPIADLGLILLVTTVGSVAVTAVVGRLIRRLGVPALLSAAGLCAGNSRSEVTFTPPTGPRGYPLSPTSFLIHSRAALSIVFTESGTGQ